MRVQIDRFEDEGLAVVLPHPDGGRSFDAPRDLSPRVAAEGDAFVVRAELAGGGF